MDISAEKPIKVEKPLALAEKIVQSGEKGRMCMEMSKMMLSIDLDKARDFKRVAHQGPGGIVKWVIRTPICQII